MCLGRMFALKKMWCRQTYGCGKSHPPLATSLRVTEHREGGRVISEKGEQELLLGRE